MYKTIEHFGSTFAFLSRQALHFSIIKSKQIWAHIRLRNPHWYIDNSPSMYFSIWLYVNLSVIFDNAGKIRTERKLVFICLSRALKIGETSASF